MNLFYKGFSAKIYFSALTDTFYGELLHDEELIAFQATQLEDIKQAFHEAIDQHYSKQRSEFF